MEISRKAWANYKNRLNQINTTASGLMQEYIDENGFDDGLVDMAYALTTKYGEASGALACEMYDAMATASGKSLPPAEIAETPSYDYTARAVYGTMKNGDNTVAATVGRMVKQTAADTTLKNAKRDNAEFAWIPTGDTCAFCMTLASRGWQRMSRATLKNGHAEHIHANCDCEFAIRFDSNTDVAGYDPERYRKIYDEAEGDTPEEKINEIRRAQYAVETGKDSTITQALGAEEKKTIPKFTPAKTKEEAEEFAKNFAHGVSYKGISLENANKVNDEMNTLTAKYPINKLNVIGNKRGRAVASANSTVLNINGTKIGGTDGAEIFERNQAWYRASIKDIQARYPEGRIPPDMQRKIKKLENDLKYSRWSVSSVAEDEAKATIAHEYGHILSDQYFGMINGRLANPNYETDYSLRGMVKKWDDAFKKAKETGDIYSISKYASTDRDEFFAECFAAREFGETLPDYVEELMVEVLENGIM